MSLVPVTSRGGGGSGGSYAVVADSIAGASVSSFDFLNVPAIYAHLELVLCLRGDVAGNFTQVVLRLNADTGINYSAQEEHSATTAVAAANTIGNNAPQFGFAPGATAPAGVFGAMICEFPNYASTTNRKSALCKNFSVHANSNGNLIQQESAIFWDSVAAISRITIYPSSGTNWVAGSRATLYGISAS